MNARRFPPSRRRAQRGVAIVEFAIIASVLIMLLIGIFEFGRVLFYWNTASEAVRLGARTAVVCDVNAAGVVKRVRSLLPLLSDANVSVSYTPTSCDINTCSFVTVSVTNVTVKTMIPFVNVTVRMPPFTTTLPRESLSSATGGSACN
ncbi:pilus assembly protein [Burkholderia cenocepacia]|jgi:Flp pilus assembly protein TadG|uniref:TadE/TadG family type IV pilus assembly protein n=1 Tax=Burkholderia cenocepacia TaxID=95486 RepID=UPI00078D9EE7|nr:TadE family protein [Burkholderia cenocepacia]AMU18978.1 pilus assembly protein TadG [Burkholderia cenocepacia]MCW3586807.1 pilus assembly protein [Burkholderia cenocepacia]MCW3627431.1 pilus assembly protein [Burkholderia cenocepacia]MCW3642941.1 pilus assembly protein [Burkholderia cenocepacia]MCW5183322.1 pilus assembly protein [Burkholderia cenocepacia]